MEMTTQAKPAYKAYALNTFRNIPQMERLTETERFDIEVVGNVLPFKVNNYVIDELIDWDHYQGDPLFNLVFPNRHMLRPEHFAEMERTLKETGDRNVIREVAHKIRLQLNPHPAGQVELNVPEIEGVKLTGIQHKYRETLLFFPSSGQTCHSYCTFCFRWPQFVGMNEIKFAMRETELLVKYLQQHQEVTDILFTGGDPMIMKYEVFRQYIEPFLDKNNGTNIQSIRIGTKSLAFWPYKFIDDEEADKFLALFERVTKSGINLAFMSHFNHPNEMKTAAVQKAIRRLRNTGLQIRTQSPLLHNINDDANAWAEMWREQVNQNCIPYYMFVARDTGARHYFEVPLVRAWEIFREAYQQVSGLCRTVRGPSMSATPGKVQVLGVSEVAGKKVLALRFLQGRNPDWVGRPFFAEYDEKATWLDELKPAFEDKFFYEDELENMYQEKVSSVLSDN
ncbi:MAG: lysine 2,3-aminomutase [Lewinellaceae bacterium]|nr:lysine 2,3-aminomutase [Lewinellaceae bacterium]